MKIRDHMAHASEALQFTLANLPSCFGNVRQHRDIRYGSGPRHTLDVHALPGIKNRPVIIFWYGGGWTSGDKAAYQFVGNALARCGYCAMLPDYRLYPSVIFPGFVEDAAQVVAYAHRHAAQWGGDPSKIIVMGHSAGAHLAALVAFNRFYMHAAGGSTRWIRAFVGLAGPYALLPNTDLFRAIFHAPARPQDWQPLRHVNARCPPSLLLQGERDTLIDSSQPAQLCDALHRHGVSAEMEVFPSATHSDMVAAFSLIARRRAPTLERCVRFIDRIVGRRNDTKAESGIGTLPAPADSAGGCTQSRRDGSSEEK